MITPQLLRTVLVVITGCVISPLAWAAPGDVAFEILDRTVENSPGGTDAAMDLMVHFDAASELAANAWGALVQISADPGARGTVTFAPPSSAGNEPNVLPSSTNPFGDFDRDHNGMSYGHVDDSGQLSVSAIYVPPSTTAPPPLDEHGNLLLPEGSGLASLPLRLSADAVGHFSVEVLDDGLTTGIAFATGEPFPDNVERHPSGGHTLGRLTVFPVLPGDANFDGFVDVSDFNIWNRFRSSSGTTYATGDFNLDGSTNDLDFDIWFANRFRSLPPAAAVPEPACVAWWIVCLVGLRMRSYSTPASHEDDPGANQ